MRHGRLAFFVRRVNALVVVSLCIAVLVMIRLSLAFFFFFMYAGSDLGMNISLGPGMSLKNLVLYSIAIMIVIDAAVKQNRNLELMSVITPFAMIIIYGLITWAAASYIFDVEYYEPKASFIKLKSSLGDEFITFLVFFYGVINAKDARWVLRTIIWIVVIGNIVTIIDAFDVPNLNLVEARPRDGRFEGFLGSVNGYGAFLDLFLPLSIALYMTEKGKLKALAFVGLLATAFALVLTFSRGAWVGILAGTVFAALYLREHIKAQIFFRFGAVGVLSVTVLVMASFVLGYSDLFSDRLGRFEGSLHVATSGRSTIWANLLAEMANRPITFITGNGYNAYENSRAFHIATHNHYLNYLYNLGLIGLFLFLTVFARILSTTRKVLADTTSETRVYLIAVVFGLFSLLVSQLFQEYHATGVLLMASLGASMRMVVETRNLNEADTVQAVQSMRTRRTDVAALGESQAQNT